MRAPSSRGRREQEGTEWRGVSPATLPVARLTVKPSFEARTDARIPICREALAPPETIENGLREDQMRNVTRREFGSLAAGISAATLTWPALGQSAEGPIRIGYTLPLSGGLAGNGRPASLAHKPLGRGNQRQGRVARAQSRARQLRRSEQPAVKCRRSTLR